MDRAERQRLKQLANEGVFATYGENSLKSQLAEALEKCLEELERLENPTVPHCESCRCYEVR